MLTENSLRVSDEALYKSQLLLHASSAFLCARTPRERIDYVKRVLSENNKNASVFMMCLNKQSKLRHLNLVI